MARFANVEVPSDKQIVVALTYVYGIGPKSAADIVKAAKIKPDTRVKDLKPAEEQRFVILSTLTIPSRVIFVRSLLATLSV